MTDKDKVSLDKFLQSSPDPSTGQLHTNENLRTLVRMFLEAYINGETRKTLSAFHLYLEEDLGVKFSYDTLRRHCKKQHPKLWNAYKEAKNA